MEEYIFRSCVEYIKMNIARIEIRLAVNDTFGPLSIALKTGLGNFEENMIDNANKINKQLI